ncbi:hypothetical protein SETIT_5G163700v2 [Setaria italica]|uniref:Uncharacterized protein n=1 Tax=Setaria italica TaxID=4555 RepID=A0A368R5J0_SETIT|nr:hypothetical protein SETIT_5G163700v2 [Setaria italica]
MAGAAAVIAREGRGGYSIWSPISGPCPAAALSSPCWPIVRSLMEEKALASITSMERDRRRLWWTRPHHRVDEAAASPPLSMPSEIMSCRLRWRWINNLLWRRNMCKYVIGVAHRMPAAALPDVLL